MGSGTIMTIALWAAFVACAALSLSGLARMTRTKGGVRDPGCWHAPLIFASGALAFLAFITASGALGILRGAALALAPLVVVTAIVWRAWLAVARIQGHRKAARAVLGGLRNRLRDAVWNAREDLRVTAGVLHRDAAPAPSSQPADSTASSPAARRRAAAGPAPTAAPRAVPPLRQDASLGPAPEVGEVAAGLHEAMVDVPEPFRAVAEWMADFEPEDQDELEEHMAEEAAGWLTVAEAAEARAEGLLDVRKLHPEFVSGMFDNADDIAELAAGVAQANRRYHDRYEDIEDWNEAEGNALPDDAREWFGDGSTAA
jgi:hypothetical protein